MLRDNLGDDLVREILCRLPPKSVIRFKCVCKSWCDLVTNPSFIAQHHRTRAAISNNSCIIVKCNRNTPNDYFFSLLDGETLIINCIDLDLPLLKGAKRRDVDIVGSCNGILCLSYWQGQGHCVALWNPAIRELRFLPNSKQPLRCNVTRLGFGFDPRTNDYKVVQIWSYNDFHSNTVSDNKVMVCTLSGNSWREIDGIIPNFQISRASVYVKGGCFWRPESSQDKIVSFDVGDEKFRVIPLPDGRKVPPSYSYLWNLGVFNECIALISLPSPYSVDIEKRSVEIWVMNDEVCWTIYMIVDLPPLGVVVKGMWKDCELLLQRIRMYGGLLFHDHGVKKAYKDHGIVIMHDLLSPVLVYNESLISIWGGNGIQKHDFKFM